MLQKMSWRLHENANTLNQNAHANFVLDRIVGVRLFPVVRTLCTSCPKRRVVRGSYIPTLICVFGGHFENIPFGKQGKYNVLGYIPESISRTYPFGTI